MVIRNFGRKKVADYLQPGQHVLLIFIHGVGDTVQFLPLYEELQRRFPETQIDLRLGNGQEAWWPCAPADELEYDLVFEVRFPCCHAESGRAPGGPTKPETSARQELGIPCPEGLLPLPPAESPLVGCHFQGTCNPGATNWPEEACAQIWQEILDFGKVPIETHFVHCWANPANKTLTFANRNVRDCRPTVAALVGLIQRCWAFVGVCSGPYWVAEATMPGRTLFLEKQQPREAYTRTPGTKLELKDFKPGQVAAWLQGL